MRPRLTKKVIRGLQQLTAAQSATGMNHPAFTDIGTAIDWVNRMANYKPGPRRAVPPHLAKLFKKRKSRRRIR